MPRGTKGANASPDRVQLSTTSGNEKAPRSHVIMTSRAPKTAEMNGTTMKDHTDPIRDSIATVQLDRIQQASVNQKSIVTHTPLRENLNLSRRYGARIWLKREDLQVVRSYKIRGAYNKISNLSEKERKGGIVCLDTIDTFVDGAAVKQVGELTYSICREVLDDLLLVPEGRICTEILTLYNQDAIVVEPAGVLSVAVLEDLREEIRGKNVVCVLSGSNNDITRTEEIKERSLLYEGLKHYFIVRFPQRAGALREFLAKVLGPTDDIAYFEYSKKNSREMGPAVIGI